MEPILARHDSMFDDEGFKPLQTPVQSRPTFFTLPAEIRTHIYELVFDTNETYADAFTNHVAPGEPAELWDDYKASNYLRPLLTCRQFHEDANLLAFSRTLFVITNPYIGLDIGQHLTTRLQPSQIESLRYIAFVADARHFRKISQWRSHPFGLDSLRLTELSIILHRSSYWHYLFDFNSALVALLRTLQGVQRLTFIRNNALVKGTLHTWYNRFITLLLKVDHGQRFLTAPPVAEKTWWGWAHSEASQSVSLHIQMAKKSHLSIEEYRLAVAPLHQALQISMENEVEDTDPMSRTSTGL